MNNTILSIRLKNSLKQFNLTLDEAIKLESAKLKQIGFGNRSIIEIESLKSKQEQEVCNDCGKTLREQMKGCREIICYRQFLPKQETFNDIFSREQELFNYLSNELNVIALKSQMDDIESIVLSMQKKQDNLYSEEEVYQKLHQLMMQIKLESLNINDDIDLKNWFNKNKKQ